MQMIVQCYQVLQYLHMKLVCDVYISLLKQSNLLNIPAVVGCTMVFGVVISVYSCKERTKTQLQKQKTGRYVKTLTIVLRMNKVQITRFV